MTAMTINICTDDELEAKAQSVLANLGLDMPTAINMFLTQVVDREALPFEVDEIQATRKKMPLSELRGIFKGKIWMADDFDTPLDIVAVSEKKSKRTREEMFDSAKGRFNIPDDFNDPLEDFKEYME